MTVRPACISVRPAGRRSDIGECRVRIRPAPVVPSDYFCAMQPSDIVRLFVLAAVWGSSFIFIRIIAPPLGALVAADARVLVAGLTLLLVSIALRKSLALRQYWRRYLIIGILNSAIPFLLISWAELHINAATAAIINATSPLFGAVIAAVWLRERLTVRMIAGIVFGITGVAVLVGWSPIALDTDVLLAIGASLMASFFYGLAGTYIRSAPSQAPLIGVAAGSQFAAALVLTPLVPLAPIPSPPTTTVILALLGLGMVCTAFAYLLYFRLIASAGATRALSVTFLVPAFGLVWGALFLHETITASSIAGCAIILLGTGFVTAKGKRGGGENSTLEMKNPTSDS